jgi:hypothetical protein
MNKREQTRVEKYLQLYPQLNKPETIEQLKQLCLDPSIGYPPNANNQRLFRQFRKTRDDKVAELAKANA